MNSLFIAGNIVKRVFKNPKEIIALLLLPVLLIGMISFAINGATIGRTATKVSKVKIGLVNLDPGVFGKRLADYIGKQKDLELVKLSKKDYLELVKSKKVSYAVVIPQGFSTMIAAGQKVDISFYSNSPEANSQSIKQRLNQYLAALYTASQTATQIVSISGGDQERILDTLLKNTGAEILSVEYRVAGASPNKAENPGAFSSLGFTVIFMMILVFVTIGTIMEDKRNLTLARMYVSPLREWEIITGNLLGSLALGLIQLVPLMVALKYILELNTVAEIIGIFVTLLCFLIATVGLGIGLSGIIKKTFNPTTLIAAVITPSSILGGCFIPESMLPNLMNKIGYIVPQKWVMQAIQKILGGADLGAIALNLVIILMFGLAFTTFGLKTIRPLND